MTHDMSLLRIDTLKMPHPSLILHHCRQALTLKFLMACNQVQGYLEVGKIRAVHMRQKPQALARMVDSIPFRHVKDSFCLFQDAASSLPRLRPAD